MSAYSDGGKDVRAGRPLDYDYGRRKAMTYSTNIEVRQDEARDLQFHYEAGRLAMIEMMIEAKPPRRRKHGT